MNDMTINLDDAKTKLVTDLRDAANNASENGNPRLYAALNNLSEAVEHFGIDEIRTRMAEARTFLAEDDAPETPEGLNNLLARVEQLPGFNGPPPLPENFVAPAAQSSVPIIPLAFAKNTKEQKAFIEHLRAHQTILKSYEAEEKKLYEQTAELLGTLSFRIEDYFNAVNDDARTGFVKEYTEKAENLITKITKSLNNLPNAQHKNEVIALLQPLKEIDAFADLIPEQTIDPAKHAAQVMAEARAALAEEESPVSSEPSEKSLSDIKNALAFAKEAHVKTTAALNALKESKISAKDPIREHLETVHAHFQKYGHEVEGFINAAAGLDENDPNYLYALTDYRKKYTDYLYGVYTYAHEYLQSIRPVINEINPNENASLQTHINDALDSLSDFNEQNRLFLQTQIERLGLFGPLKRGLEKLAPKGSAGKDTIDSIGDTFHTHPEAVNIFLAIQDGLKSQGWGPWLVSRSNRERYNQLKDLVAIHTELSQEKDPGERYALQKESQEIFADLAAHGTNIGKSLRNEPEAEEAELEEAVQSPAPEAEAAPGKIDTSPNITYTLGQVYEPVSPHTVRGPDGSAIPTGYVDLAELEELAARVKTPAGNTEVSKTNTHPHPLLASVEKAVEAMKAVYAQIPAELRSEDAKNDFEALPEKLSDLRDLFSQPELDGKKIKHLTSSILEIADELNDLAESLDKKPDNFDTLINGMNTKTTAAKALIKGYETPTSPKPEVAPENEEKQARFDQLRAWMMHSDFVARTTPLPLDDKDKIVNAALDFLWTHPQGIFPVYAMIQDFRQKRKSNTATELVQIQANLAAHDALKPEDDSEKMQPWKTTKRALEKSRNTAISGTVIEQGRSVQKLISSNSQEFQEFQRAWPETYLKLQQTVSTGTSADVEPEIVAEATPGAIDQQFNNAPTSVYLLNNPSFGPLSQQPRVIQHLNGVYFGTNKTKTATRKQRIAVGNFIASTIIHPSYGSREEHHQFVNQRLNELRETDFFKGRDPRIMQDIRALPILQAQPDVNTIPKPVTPAPASATADTSPHQPAPSAAPDTAAQDGPFPRILGAMRTEAAEQTDRTLTPSEAYNALLQSIDAVRDGLDLQQDDLKALESSLIATEQAANAYNSAYNNGKKPQTAADIANLRKNLRNAAVPIAISADGLKKQYDRLAKIPRKHPADKAQKRRELKIQDLYKTIRLLKNVEKAHDDYQALMALADNGIKQNARALFPYIKDLYQSKVKIKNDAILKERSNTFLNRLMRESDVLEIFAGIRRGQGEGRLNWSGARSHTIRLIRALEESQDSPQIDQRLSALSALGNNDVFKPRAERAAEAAAANNTGAATPTPNTGNGAGEPPTGNNNAKLSDDARAELSKAAQKTYKTAISILDDYATSKYWKNDVESRKKAITIARDVFHNHEATNDNLRQVFTQGYLFTDAFLNEVNSYVEGLPDNNPIKESDRKKLAQYRAAMNEFRTVYERHLGVAPTMRADATAAAEPAATHTAGGPGNTGTLNAHDGFGEDGGATTSRARRNPATGRSTNTGNGAGEAPRVGDRIQQPVAGWGIGSSATFIGVVARSAMKRWPMIVAGVTSGIYIKGALIAAAGTVAAPALVLPLAVLSGMLVGGIITGQLNYRFDHFYDQGHGTIGSSMRAIFSTVKHIFSTDVKENTLTAFIPALLSLRPVFKQAYAQMREKVANTEEEVGRWERIGMTLSAMKEIDSRTTAIGLGAITGGLGTGIGLGITGVAGDEIKAGLGTVDQTIGLTDKVSYVTAAVDDQINLSGAYTAAADRVGGIIKAGAGLVFSDTAVPLAGYPDGSTQITFGNGDKGIFIAEPDTASAKDGILRIDDGKGTIKFFRIDGTGARTEMSAATDTTTFVEDTLEGQKTGSYVRHYFDNTKTQFIAGGNGKAGVITLFDSFGAPKRIFDIDSTGGQHLRAPGSSPMHEEFIGNPATTSTQDGYLKITKNGETTYYSVDENGRRGFAIATNQLDQHFVERPLTGDGVHDGAWEKKHLSGRVVTFLPDADGSKAGQLITKLQSGETTVVKLNAAGEVVQPDAAADAIADATTDTGRVTAFVANDPTFAKMETYIKGLVDNGTLKGADAKAFEDLITRAKAGSFTALNDLRAGISEGGLYKNGTLVDIAKMGINRDLAKEVMAAIKTGFADTTWSQPGFKAAYDMSNAHLDGKDVHGNTFGSAKASFSAPGANELQAAFASKGHMITTHADGKMFVTVTDNIPSPVKGVPILDQIFKGSTETRLVELFVAPDSTATGKLINLAQLHMINDGIKPDDVIRIARAASTGNINALNEIYRHANFALNQDGSTSATDAKLLAQLYKENPAWGKVAGATNRPI